MMIIKKSAFKAPPRQRGGPGWLFLGVFLLAAVPPFLAPPARGADATAGLGRPDADRAVASEPRTAKPPPSAFYAKPGPWGKLRCNYVFIEAPASLVNGYPMPSTQVRWSFPESAAGSLPGLFKGAGLPENFRAALLDPAKQVRDGTMIHLFPATVEVEAMTPAMREALYPELRKHPVNEFYFAPVKMATETVEEWFGSSKLRPELIAKIRRLTYHYNQCLALSDVAVMLQSAGSEEEARLILKTLTRTRTLMIQMEFPPDTQMEPLLDYWTVGLGSRRKDIEPIMRSIMDIGGTERLALSHVLPALPRKLLYTYPGPEYLIQGRMPDCHWTSLNFFNYEPHNFYLDDRVKTDVIMETHDDAAPPYRYGDILLFCDVANGDVFHSCIYLADDMVYTKNGINAFAPWVIMKIEELGRIYLHGKENRVKGFRHKKSS
ncbi:MAG: hypothetical protein HZA89_14145 [Verrucomicrobia bacterium]|nr:hypothetical protein [Verrucomicrobiota bacterium]